MLSLLAQLDALKKLDSAAPALSAESSATSTWIMAAVIVVGIIAITFKTSKRNTLEKD